MQQDPGQLVALGAIWYVAFLFSTTFHEAAHAFVSWRLGDSTAYHGGQVSLNPLPHMRREPFGMLIVPLISFATGGWMFGWASAPYDPSWAHRHPRRSGAMALAGPCANLILFLLAAIAIRVGNLLGALDAPSRLSYARIAVATGEAPVVEGIATLLSVFFSLNLILFLFNLLPLPPMDGSGVLQLFLPEDTSRRLQELLRQPMVGLIGIVIAWKLFPSLLWPVFHLMIRVLYPHVTYS